MVPKMLVSVLDFYQKALEGKAYGLENKDNTEALNKINDFEWLRKFVASMKKRVTHK